MRPPDTSPTFDETDREQRQQRTASLQSLLHRLDQLLNGDAHATEQINQKRLESLASFVYLTYPFLYRRTFYLQLWVSALLVAQTTTLAIVGVLAQQTLPWFVTLIIWPLSIFIPMLCSMYGSYKQWKKSLDNLESIEQTGEFHDR